MLPNQYGVDMGNILGRVSNIKTARQNRQNSETRNNIMTKKLGYMDEDRENVLMQRDQQQSDRAYRLSKRDERSLKKMSREQLALIEANNEKAATTLIGISNLPIEQQQAMLDKAISALPKDQQEAYKGKYGKMTPEKIPYYLNDVMGFDKAIKLHTEKAKYESKSKYKKEETTAKNKEWDRRTKVQHENIKERNALKDEDIGIDDPLALDDTQDVTAPKKTGTWRDYTPKGL